jgi:hypothetical protein
MVASLGRVTAKVTVAEVVVGVPSTFQPVPDSSMHFQRLVRVTVLGVE